MKIYYHSFRHFLARVRRDGNTVTGSTGDPAYDTDVGPEDIGVFAEIERLCYDETVMTPGSHRTGKALASGVYFVRLATGEGVSTGKLVLSK